MRGGLAGSGGQDGDGLWAGSYEVTSARLSSAEVVVQLPGRQITEKTSTTVESVKHEVRPGDCTTILIFTAKGALQTEACVAGAGRVDHIPEREVAVRELGTQAL